MEHVCITKKKYKEVVAMNTMIEIEFIDPLELTGSVYHWTSNVKYYDSDVSLANRS